MEWPPSSVLDIPRYHDDPHVMSEWVRHLQTWLEENSTAGGERKHSDDSLSSDTGNDSSIKKIIILLDDTTLH